MLILLLECQHPVIVVMRMAPLFWKFDTVIFELGPVGAIALCFFLALLYVGSLYVGTRVSASRDDPVVIKGRFIRVLIVCLLAVPLFWLFSTSSHSVKARDIFTLLGLRFRGSIQAAVLPLLLTASLFLGPLTLHYLDGIFRLYGDSKYWKSSVRNLVWLRNHVVGPFTEEFVFRACMLPVLVPALGESWSLVVCPLFFGVAHMHHLWEKVQAGVDFSRAFFSTAFQFGYTTVFGIYSAFLFLRTGHLVAPLLAHVFCNHMGFPNFSEISTHPVPRRYYVAVAFVAGVVLWSILLFPLTEPNLFANDLYNI